MNKEWVARKNEELKREIENDKKLLYDEILNADFLSGKEKKSLIKMFNQKEYSHIAIYYDTYISCLILCDEKNMSI